MNILSKNNVEGLINGYYKFDFEKCGFFQESEALHFFRKEKKDYIDLITYTGLKTEEQFFYTKPMFSRYIKIVEDYWINLASKINVQIGNHFATIDLYPVTVKKEILDEPVYDRVYQGFKAESSNEGVRDFCKWSVSFFEEYLFPASQKYLDLKEIDKFVNAEVAYREGVQSFLGTDGTVFKRLVIAKLVGNPIYEEMVRTYRNGYEWYLNKGKEKGGEYWGNYPEVFEELFNRLKDVKPLKNTVLS